MRIRRSFFVRFCGDNANFPLRRRISLLRPAIFAPTARRFRLSPEWRILIKRLKVPPFLRKPESHSCLRRREAAGNCTAFGNSLRLRR
ncbi:MAG: hypothetical protein ACR2QC_12870 [Gammaproteobacteria bacterium]